MANIEMYKGFPITFQNKNGKTMVNATQMGKAFGKQPKDWLRTQASKDFIEALSKVKKCLFTDLQQVVAGAPETGGGTWFHEDVALEYARWLSPKFAIWCNDHIKELLTTGSTSLNLPTDYLSALKALVKSEEEKQALTLENKVMKPKADYFDGLVERKLLLNFRDTAKEFGMGQNELIKWLMTNHFLFRDQNKKLKPYNEHVVDGLFEVKEWKNGKVAGNQTLITVKGRETFRLLLNK